MKIVLVSNYLNHHQLPICEAFINKPDVEFKFIATTPVPEARMKLGYSNMNSQYDFVVRTYEDDMQDGLAYDLCSEADVVIIGSAPDKYIKKRLKNKLTFRYSERIYKKKPAFYEIPLRAVKYYLSSGRYKNLHLLCASAYTAGDYAKTGTFLNKSYKWGYFPSVKYYDNVDCLVSQKKSNSVLWAGRLIDWKHPEHALEVARRLKQDEYEFVLNVIGMGDMEDELKSIIQKNNLDDCVHLLGAMPPEAVREYMENSEIFLFTSDCQEGWGAVLNESMNSACAVVASHEIGAAPFLINDGENGYIYKDGNIDDLYSKVKALIDDAGLCEKFQLNAYKTIAEEWNGQNAADKFVGLTEKILAGDSSGFTGGVCSKAEKLEDNWYK